MMPQLAGIQCSVCGFLHPAPECQRPGGSIDSGVTGQTDSRVDNIDLTFLFSNLKNVCYSKISQGNIQNHKKLFSHIIIEITKIIENYKE